MRVVVCLQERVDPAAARALARLLFSGRQPDEQEPDDSDHRRGDESRRATVAGPATQGGGRQ
jgi:hypothetical protein